MHSIRVKILTIMIAAILTSLVSLGSVGVYTVGRISNQNSVEKMNLLSENIAKTLDAYLNSIQQSVDMAINIANDTTSGMETDLITSALESPDHMYKLDNFLKEHSADILRSFTSIANNTSGVVTYYYCINMDLGSSEHGFFYSKVGFDKFEEQTPLYSDDLDPNDLEHTTWYYTPIKNHAPTWIGPYLAHYLEERWTVSYVAPIYKNDILLGVMGMDILFSTMVEQISGMTVYDTGFVILLDRDGHVLYHPHLEIGSIPENVSESLNIEKFRQENNRNELIRYNANGEYRQLSFSTLSNGMKLVVTAPVSEITAFQQRMLTIYLVIAVCILIIFATVSMLLMNHITKPLMDLAAASKRIADGDYDIALNYHDEDEVGVLTNSFQLMQDHLKLYISDLNSRAYQDALTGVKNKGAFDIYVQKLNDMIHLGDQNNLPEFAIVMADCNYLKEVNDEYGHAKGDIYLVLACRALCSVYSHSPVFRIGGDEFVVMLQGQDYADREQLFTHFDEETAAINKEAVYAWEKANLSKGMAEYRPGVDQNVEQVLHRADLRMYEDKRKHKQNNA